MFQSLLLYSHSVSNLLGSHFYSLFLIILKQMTGKFFSGQSNTFVRMAHQYDNEFSTAHAL